MKRSTYVSLIVIISIYLVFWFIASVLIKKEVSNFLEKNYGNLKYDSLESSNLPFNFNLKITNPELKLSQNRMNQLTIRSQNDVVIHINLLLMLSKVEMKGDYQYDVAIGSKIFKFSSLGDNLIAANFDSSFSYFDNIFSFKGFESDDITFKSLHINSKNTEIFDRDSQEKLYMIGNLNSEISVNKISEGNMKLDLDVDMKDLHSTSYDSKMFYSLFSSKELYVLNNIFTYPQIDRMKITLANDVDISTGVDIYNIAINSKLDLLFKGLSSFDVYEDTKILLSLNKAKGGDNFKIDLDVKSNNNVRSLKYKDFSCNFFVESKFLKNINHKDCKDLLPNFEPSDRLSTSLNGQIKGSLNEKGDKFVNIDNLEFAINDNSIKFVIDYSKKNLEEYIDLSMEMINYKSIISNLDAYFKNRKNIGNKALSKEIKSIHHSVFSNGAKDVIKIIDKYLTPFDNRKNIHIRFSGDAKGKNPKIFAGKKPLSGQKIVELMIDLEKSNIFKNRANNNKR